MSVNQKLVSLHYKAPHSNIDALMSLSDIYALRAARQTPPRSLRMQLFSLLHRSCRSIHPGRSTPRTSLLALTVVWLGRTRRRDRSKLRPSRTPPGAPEARRRPAQGPRPEIETRKPRNSRSLQSRRFVAIRAKLRLRPRWGTATFTRSYWCGVLKMLAAKKLHKTLCHFS